jgi:WD40 repeat protein
VLHFVDVETGTPIATMPAHSMCIFSCDYHPLENVVCSAGDDKLVKVWDLNSGKCVTTIASHASWVWRARFSSDGTLLGTASQDHSAKVFDWRTNRMLHQLRHRETVFSVSVRPWFRAVWHCMVALIRGLCSCTTSTCLLPARTGAHASGVCGTVRGPCACGDE